MKNTLLTLIALLFIFTSCKKEQDPFQIGKQHIGFLTDSTQVKDLDVIFNSDSIVKHSGGGDEFLGNINNIEIFEKGGKKLLILSPSRASDSTATIKNVRIIDSRFKTNKNVTTLSTFKNIQDSYTISSIDNLINSIIVSVNDINASFTIDKKELPANLRFDMNLRIEATHIPDNAKIKYFFINWN